MKIQAGEKIRPIHLPAIDGSTFDLSNLAGRPFMLSFFRFASCPFCNMRIHYLVKHFEEFGDDFAVVAIFDSSLDNLRKYTAGHKAPFPILADEQNTYYRAYGIEHSVAGMLKGMVTRMPILLRGLLRGHIPWTIKGSMTTMPADFLVGPDGVVAIAHYGQDDGDHLPIGQVKQFARSHQGLSFHKP